MSSLLWLPDHCRQWPRNTRYQADATPYLGRTSTGWIAPACGWRTHSITSLARASFWHPGCVVGNHEPAIAALFVNLRLDDGKAESLAALVFAFDAHNAGRPRRRLIDVDLRRLFRR